MKMNLHLPSFDSLFISEESKEEKITKIKINEIVDFENHPFHVKMDDDMVKLIDSIQENGQLMPVLVRPNKNGKGYEMVAGHRRKFALTQIGANEIDAIVRDLDDDQAVLLMVDSNVQREYISPTEKGYAYKMRLEAMKHQGKRNDLTSTQVGQKLEYKKKYSIENLAEAVGESRNQVQRYIRLTELIQPLQDMIDGVDEKGFNISFNPAYELSFLTKQDQQIVVDEIYSTCATPSLAQAQQLKRDSQENKLTQESVFELLSNEKANQKVKIAFNMEDIHQYFPKSYTPKQCSDTIIKLLEKWSKNRERSANER